MIGSAANLAVQGGVKSADGEAVQGFELMGSLMLFEYWRMTAMGSETILPGIAKLQKSVDGILQAEGSPLQFGTPTPTTGTLVLQV
ncbi:MAG: hypothetical protein ABR924_15245 [Terracidiphilus sp.]